MGILIVNKSPKCLQNIGSILIIVLWVTAGVVGLALYFSHRVKMEIRAADARVASLQAEQAIEGAIRYLKEILAEYGPGEIPNVTTYLCENVPVAEARFWILGRDTNSWQIGPTRPVFGLVDEASKLNLNTASAEMLMMLPHMTSDLAASIVKWRGESTSGTVVGGVDDMTYTQLNPPYRLKSAPFETVEELRMVYGINMEILFGEDWNCNGILDPNENDGEVWLPSDNRDGKLDPGLWEYVTVFTREPNSGKTNINDTASLSLLLQETFGEVRAMEIMAQLGLVQQGPAQPAQGGTSRPPQSGAPAMQPTSPGFTSVIDFYLRSGMSFDEFSQISDKITVTNAPFIEGLVNVNTASETVLACIPGIGVQYAPSLVAYRISHPDKLRCIAWIVDVLGPENARLAAPYLSVKSYQFSADIVAVGRLGRGYKRVRVVFDVSAGTPSIVFCQDLTHLGWALGTEIREQIKQARSLLACK